VNENMKSLANNILDQCQQQGLTFRDTKLLLDLMKQRVVEGQECVMEEAGDYQLKFRPF